MQVELKPTKTDRNQKRFAKQNWVKLVQNSGMHRKKVLIIFIAGGTQPQTQRRALIPCWKLSGLEIRPTATAAKIKSNSHSQSFSIKTVCYFFSLSQVMVIITMPGTSVL